MTEFPIQKDGYLAFDALTLKQHIKNALNKSGVFTDQQYEGSYISTFIDIIAYSYHTLLFYLNKTSTESIFSESQIYENINRIVKMLDYKPAGRSTAILSFDLNATDSLNAATYVIPRYSYISARGSIPYAFNEDVAFVKATDDNELITSVSGNRKLLYQGIWREYPVYTATGDSNEIVFLTPGAKVLIDHNNIDVYVKQASTGKWSKWDRTFSLYLENGTSEKFEARFNESEQYEIKFGNNINGKQLSENDTVAIYYLETRGTSGEVGVGALNKQRLKALNTKQLQQIFIDINEIDAVNYMSDFQLSQLTFSNGSISTFASDPETVEEIRQNAPATFRSQFRLVTQSDYETFITTNFAQLIHSVKVVNNWTYLTSYLKYYYDLGLTDPNTVSRVLYNQLNFADACNFNNVYVFAVPKIIINTLNDISYLTPSNKQLILSTTNQIKTMTSETIILDPIYVSFRLCAPKSTGGITLEDAENTQLEVIKNPNSRRDDGGIIQDIQLIFDDYFRRENVELGQSIDITQMIADILSVAGVDKFILRNTVTGEGFEGLSLVRWDPIYPSATPSLIFNNQVLDPFMFPIFDDPNLSQKIKVISKDKIFENIEY